MKKILLIIIITSISSICYSQYQYLGSGASTTKLLLHLNGNSLDASGNSNNGTDSLITYGLTYGKFNQGASFNGSSSKIKFADSSSLRPTGSYTISAWINTTTNADQAIFSSFSFVTYRAGIHCRVATTTGRIIFLQGDNAGNTQNTNWFQVSSTISVNNGKWHLINCVYDGSYLKIYIDGNLNNQLACSVNAVYNATNFVRVGLRMRTDVFNEYYFNGSIDDLSLDKAWTSSEIKRYFSYSKGYYVDK